MMMGTSASATTTALGFVSLFLDANFLSPVSDQLIHQTDARRQMRKHATGLLYGGVSPLGGRLLSFCRVSHPDMVSAGNADDSSQDLCQKSLAYRT
jgi:hypothetical protein